MADSAQQKVLDELEQAKVAIRGTSRGPPVKKRLALVPTAETALSVPQRVRRELKRVKDEFRALVARIGYSKETVIAIGAFTAHMIYHLVYACQSDLPVYGKLSLELETIRSTIGEVGAGTILIILFLPAVMRLVSRYLLARVRQPTRNRVETAGAKIGKPALRFGNAILLYLRAFAAVAEMTRPSFGHGPVDEGMDNDILWEGSRNVRSVRAVRGTDRVLSGLSTRVAENYDSLLNLGTVARQIANDAWDSSNLFPIETAELREGTRIAALRGEEDQAIAYRDPPVQLAFAEDRGLDELTEDDIRQLCDESTAISDRVKSAMKEQFRADTGMVWDPQTAIRYVNSLEIKSKPGGANSYRALNATQLAEAVGNPELGPNITQSLVNKTGEPVAFVPIGGMIPKPMGLMLTNHSDYAPDKYGSWWGPKLAGSDEVGAILNAPPAKLFSDYRKWAEVQGTPALKQALDAAKAAYKEQYEEAKREYDARESQAKPKRDLARRMAEVRRREELKQTLAAAGTTVAADVAGYLAGATLVLASYALDFADEWFHCPHLIPQNCGVCVPEKDGSFRVQDIPDVFELLVAEWNESVQQEIFESVAAMRDALPSEAPAFGSEVVSELGGDTGDAPSPVPDIAVSSRLVDAKESYDELKLTKEGSAVKVDIVKRMLSGSSDLRMDQGYYWLRMFLYEKACSRKPGVSKATLNRLFDCIKLGTAPGRQDVCQRYSEDPEKNYCKSETDKTRQGIHLLDFCTDYGIVAAIQSGPGDLGTIHKEFVSRGKLKRICTACAGYLQHDAISSTSGVLLLSPIVRGKPPTWTGRDVNSIILKSVTLLEQASARIKSAAGAERAADVIVSATTTSKLTRTPADSDDDSYGVMGGLFD